MIYETIGFVGGALFAIGCVPVAWTAWRTGRGIGAPLVTQWLLFVACGLYAVFLYGAFGAHFPFVFLVIEVVCWGVALRYHYRPRSTDEGRS